MEVATIERDFTQPEITVALETLAFHGGSLDEAVTQLEEEGLEVSRNKLEYWSRRKHRDQYKLARAKEKERLKERLADAHNSAAADALRIEREATAKLRAKLEADELSAKDLVGVQGKAGINSGIHTEKGQLLDGEATARVERTPDEIARALQKRGARIAWDIDGEAEEEEAPALPEGEQGPKS